MVVKNIYIKEVISIVLYRIKLVYSLYILKINRLIVVNDFSIFEKVWLVKCVVKFDMFICYSFNVIIVR